MATSAGTPNKLHVLGIAGSLRARSYNRSLLRAARELAPAGMEIRIFERLGEIPLFNGDVEAEGDPEPVGALKRAIREADALLIATPEYNYSVPGVLKNAIDWASRPPDASVLRGKPAAIMGASPAATGTARAQLALRQSLVFTATPAVLRPEVLVARAHEKTDAEGRLTDEPTRKFVGELLGALAEWTALLHQGRWGPAPPGRRPVCRRSERVSADRLRSRRSAGFRPRPEAGEIAEVVPVEGEGGRPSTPGALGGCEQDRHAAGEAERALPFALAAAADARAELAFEVAEDHCRIAERSAAGSLAETRRSRRLRRLHRSAAGNG